MRKKSILCSLLLAGALVAGASFSYADSPNPQELRRDRREIRQDNREIRQDRRELKADSRELRRDLRNGAPQAEIRADKREIRRDTRELRRDKRERRQDIRELRRDRKQQIMESPGVWSAHGPEGRLKRCGRLLNRPYGTPSLFFPLFPALKCRAIFILSLTGQPFDFGHPHEHAFRP